MLSIITPLHLEPFLGQTIDSLLDNAVGDIEIIPVFDGAELVPMRKDSRIKPLVIDHVGMRGAINAGIAAAKGKWIMKIDCHCAVAPGYDKAMVEASQEDWLMVPRRWALATESWGPNFDGRPPRDYHFLSFPGVRDGIYGYSMLGLNWFHHPKAWASEEVSDTMSIQGSCWMAHRDYFMRNLFPLNDSPQAYGTFVQECVELCNKYWLGGGAVKVNKRTYYCHFAKRQRHYHAGMFSRLHRRDRQALRSHEWCAKHWMGNREPGMKYPLSWLIEKFWPVPSWPDNWQEVWDRHEEPDGLHTPQEGLRPGA